MRWGLRSLAAMLGATALACARADQPAPEPPIADTLTLPPPETEAPAVALETITIEGLPQPLEVTRFEAPVDFPLGFETVVPGDMAVSFETTGEGDVIRFEAAFAGTLRPDAALSFRVLPRGTDADDARGAVEEAAQQLGARLVSSPARSWAVREYDLDEDVFGFIALGERQDVWFYFLARYPPEFGDGMGPRIDLILRRWRWVGDGTPLLPPGS